MDWPKPAPQEFWKAVEHYLPIAYPKNPAPAAVRGRLETLRSTPAASFYQCTVWETDAVSGRLSLRLGNFFYPHMKLVIEPTPANAGHLFRPDTHDRHVRPAPDSKEYTMFCELMENNQKLASAIDTAWEQAGLPTFKQYLRDDLKRRQSAAATPLTDSSR